MSEVAVEHWQVKKPATRSKGGVVAAQSARAARVGAAVLEEGGNAVDAAVATAMALSVAEPWMSGLGGCGYMVVYRAKDQTVQVVDFSCVAPRALDPNVFLLTDGAPDDDLFGWPEVEGARNVYGPLSIAVPGSVAGLARAHEAFGSMAWPRLLKPAVDMAKEGHRVDWWSTLKVAGEAKMLRDNAAAAATWLPDGLPPVASERPAKMIDMGQLSGTLERLAEAGARDFYEGALAESLLADLRASGAVLSAEDLAAYQAELCVPRTLLRGEAEIHLLDGLNAGPTFAAALQNLPSIATGPAQPEAYGHYAKSLADAYERRFAEMGHDADKAGKGSTTHLSVMDSEGNMVALTNTLLSLFGSKVLSASTGVMLNNGIMWFDPRPGRANSIAPGVRPLCNMTPMVVTRGGEPWFALGGSGGRRILAACFQMTSFLVDGGLGLDDAVHQARINVDGSRLVEVDSRLDMTVHAAIAAHGLETVAAEPLVTPHPFANPQIVLRDGDDCLGATQVRLPIAAAIGAGVSG